jgi:hypothetical protein
VTFETTKEHQVPVLLYLAVLCISPEGGPLVVGMHQQQQLYHGCPAAVTTNSDVTS